MGKVLLYLLALIPVAGSAQTSASLTGYLRDEVSGERLNAASVFSLTDNSGTRTNAYGYFNLKLKSGHQRITVNMVGYYPDTIVLTLDRDSTLDLHLRVRNHQLSEVIVNDADKSHLSIGQMNKAALRPAEIKALPRLAGEVDVIKAFQLMPGVRSGKEGSSDLHVRGGGPDQNLILLDGVPIYHSSHSLGLFSVFNADAIKSAELSKGGFPSRYGGRLSSVLDIQLKEGNRDHFRYDVSTGLISSKLLVEGPLKSDNTTFMLGARRTYLDVFAALAQARAQNKTSYGFYDLNAKVNHQFSSKDRLYFSIYSGNDRLRTSYQSATGDDENLNSLSWGSVTSALRYNHLFSRSLFGNLTLTYTKYQFEVRNLYRKESEETDYSLSYLSKIGDAGFKTDFDYIHSNNHFIRFGSNMVVHHFSPNVTRLKSVDNGLPLADTALSNNQIRALEYYLYSEDEIRLSDRLQLNAGLHFSGFNVQQKHYFSLQPRINVNWLLTERDALRASYVTMSQYLHLLTTTGSGSPADLWIPSTRNIAPQKSWQGTIGYARTLSKNYEINVDGFYKEMNGIIEYTQGASFLDDNPEAGLIEEASQSFDSKVSTGAGEAYGAEVFLKKTNGNTSGWIGYTLSWSNRLFEDINNGKAFPYKYDNRHNLSMVANHQLKKGIRLSATWVYNSGLPATVPLSSYLYYDENGLNRGSIENVNVRNNIRMRSYHRLDLGISFIKQKKKGERIWNISVYNVYNRRNPYFIDVGNHSSNGRTYAREYSLLPVIPSFSYSYSFK
ncbi:MAG TPA: TonB-dependent receptor [Sphingobacteriaceae bacterium]